LRLSGASLGEPHRGTVHHEAGGSRPSRSAKKLRKPGKMPGFYCAAINPAPFLPPAVSLAPAP